MTCRMRKQTVFWAAALAAVIVFCMLFFVPAGVAQASEGTLTLYAWGKDDEGNVYAFFTAGGGENALASVPCTTASYIADEGEFFYASHYDVTFDARAAADAAAAAAPEGVTVTEDNLKIVFVYATMYESIVSNAEKSEQDGVWMHTLAVSPDDGTVTFAASSRGAKSENWYALLIGAAVLCIAAAAAGIAAARSLKCRKNRNRPTE